MWKKFKKGYTYAISPKQLVLLKVIQKRPLDGEVVTSNATQHLRTFKKDKQRVCSFLLTHTKPSRQINHFFFLLCIQPTSTNKLQFDFRKVTSHIPLFSFMKWGAWTIYSSRRQGLGLWNPEQQEIHISLSISPKGTTNSWLLSGSLIDNKL